MIVNGWYQAVPGDTPDDRLGAVVQEGLRVGDDPLDIPTEDHQKLLKPLLKAAKTTSFTAFAKDARAVGISRHDIGEYAIIPMRNPDRRRRNSFLDMVEKELIVPGSASAEELGRAVREGLGLSIAGGSAMQPGGCLSAVSPMAPSAISGVTPGLTDSLSYSDLTPDYEAFKG